VESKVEPDPPNPWEEIKDDDDVEKEIWVTEEPELPVPQHLTRLERLVFLALLREELITSRASEILAKPLMDIRQQLANWMEENDA
jgi:hypothetical protein